MRVLRELREMSREEVYTEMPQLVGEQVWSFAKGHVNVEGLRESCTTLYEFAETIRDVASAMSEDFPEHKPVFQPLAKH